MQRSSFNPWIVVAGLASLLMASNSQAQVYKWVDANGKTHYSEKKEEAGNARTEELKLKSQPKSPQSDNSSAQYWREQERDLQQRQQAQSQKDRTNKPPAAAAPKSLTMGKEDGAEASRCALAQDIRSGAVTIRHRDGTPTNAQDLAVADNDIRAFCR